MEIIPTRNFRRARKNISQQGLATQRSQKGTEQHPTVTVHHTVCKNSSNNQESLTLSPAQKQRSGSLQQAAAQEERGAQHRQAHKAKREQALIEQGGGRDKERGANVLGRSTRGTRHLGQICWVYNASLKIKPKYVQAVKGLSKLSQIKFQDSQNCLLT